VVKTFKKYEEKIRAKLGSNALVVMDCRFQFMSNHVVDMISMISFASNHDHAWIVAFQNMSRPYSARVLDYKVLISGKYHVYFSLRLL